MRYNVDISPMDEMKELVDVEESKRRYRKMTAHEKLMEELRAINLAPSDSETPDIAAQLKAMM